MTFTIEARNENGAVVGKLTTDSTDEARSWIIRNSAPRWVRTFNGLPGVGIVTVIRTIEGHAIGYRRVVRVGDGAEFIDGGPELLGEAS